MLRKLIYFILLLFIASGIALYYCNKKIDEASIGKIFTDIDAIPYNKVGLLLGTSKYVANGRINPYYQYRVQAAAELIKSGKIKYIIASGDNSFRSYDEPSQMRADLIHAGIDSTLIFLDYAGFRTFDSVIRAKKVFGQDSVTIISQKFHNQRAIFIASRENMFAIGFDARDVNRAGGFKTQLREKFARVKVFLDYMFGKKPKFLGAKVPIPD